MDEEDKTPIISKELINFLENVIPPTDHKPSDDIKEIMFQAGKREIVNFLKDLHLNQ